MNGTLNLTRKPGQKICIGPDVTVKVVRVRGNHVEISVCAPKDVSVDREEIALKKARGEPPPVHAA
jgi:carbon storage regulator